MAFIILTSEYGKLAKKYKVDPISNIRGYRECNCCSSIYLVKFADLKRGWGTTCSKSCAAIYKTGGKHFLGKDK